MCPGGACASAGCGASLGRSLATRQTSLGAHMRIPGVWYCQQCGAQRKLDHYTRKRKYCSMKCHGLSQVGKANPAYRDGSRARTECRRRFVRPTDEQISQARQWVSARRALGSAADAAKRIGISLRAMYLYSSDANWKGRIAP